MSSLRHYQGMDFELWEGQQSWFWFVLDPYRDGGTIGAAASENQALRDACLSIDEMITEGVQPRLAVEWEITLSNLEQYLARCCDRMA